MNPELSINQPMTHEIERRAQLVYAQTAAEDLLSSEGSAFVVGRNNLEISVDAESGYRISVTPGLEPIRLLLNNEVSMTLTGPLFARIHNGEFSFANLPLELTGVGEDYITELFANHVDRLLAEPRMIIENFDAKARENTILDMADIRIADTVVAAFTDEEPVYVHKNIKPNPRQVRDDAIGLLDYHDEQVGGSDFEISPAGGFIETRCFQGIWAQEGEEEEVVGIVSRETDTDGGMVIHMALHKQNGFLIAFEDGLKELVDTLELILEPDTTLVLGSRGYEKLRDNQLLAVYNTLRRCEIVDDYDIDP